MKEFLEKFQVFKKQTSIQWLILIFFFLQEKYHLEVTSITCKRFFIFSSSWNERKQKKVINFKFHSFLFGFLTILLGCLRCLKSNSWSLWHLDLHSLFLMYNILFLVLLLCLSYRSLASIRQVTLCKFLKWFSEWMDRIGCVYAFNFNFWEKNFQKKNSKKSNSHLVIKWTKLKSFPISFQHTQNRYQLSCPYFHLFVEQNNKTIPFPERLDIQSPFIKAALDVVCIDGWLCQCHIMQIEMLSLQSLSSFHCSLLFIVIIAHCSLLIVHFSLLSSHIVVLWYDMVWCVVLWCDMVWCDVMFCSFLFCAVVFCGVLLFRARSVCRMVRCVCCVVLRCCACRPTTAPHSKHSSSSLTLSLSLTSTSNSSKRWVCIGRYGWNYSFSFCLRWKLHLFCFLVCVVVVFYSFFFSVYPRVAPGTVSHHSLIVQMLRQQLQEVAEKARDDRSMGRFSFSRTKPSDSRKREDNKKFSTYALQYLSQKEDGNNIQNVVSSDPNSTPTSSPSIVNTEIKTSTPVSTVSTTSTTSSTSPSNVPISTKGKIEKKKIHPLSQTEFTNIENFELDEENVIIQQNCEKRDKSTGFVF